jgi:hypothetical protein
VEWSGENPGISLKTDAHGPFTTLASFFRVVLSPHGAGHALVLMRAPNDAAGDNVCYTDNEKLARYLVAGFVAHFGAFRNIAGLSGLKYQAIDGVQASGDPATSYSETVTAKETAVKLTWSGLGRPFCFALPPELSATGQHTMPSLFIGCERASITVNGETLPGKPVPRVMAGHAISTAMLAFSETWIRA